MPFNTGTIKGKLMRLFGDSVMDGGLESINVNVGTGSVESKKDDKMELLKDGDGEEQNKKDNMEEICPDNEVKDEEVNEDNKCEAKRNKEAATVLGVVGWRNMTGGELSLKLVSTSAGKPFRCPCLCCPATALDLGELNLHLGSLHEDIPRLLETDAKAGASPCDAGEKRCKESESGGAGAVSVGCVSDACASTGEDSRHDFEDDHGEEEEEGSKEYSELLREGGEASGEHVKGLGEDCGAHRKGGDLEDTKDLELTKMLAKMSASMEVIKCPIVNVEGDQLDSTNELVEISMLEKSGEDQHAEEVDGGETFEDYMEDPINVDVEDPGEEDSGEGSMKDSGEDSGNPCESLED